jgi:CMP-N-acetylneuraminic acid synthetase
MDLINSKIYYFDYIILNSDSKNYFNLSQKFNSEKILIFDHYFTNDLLDTIL